MSQGLSELPLAEIKYLCQQERNHFRQVGELLSPACVELFRRAFVMLDSAEEPTTDADCELRRQQQKQWAIADLIELFEKLVLSWIQRAKDGKYAHLAPYVTPEAPALIQNRAFANFFQYAPKRPELLATDQLGRMMTYLERCVETATKEILLELRREALQESYTVRLDRFQEDEEGSNSPAEQIMAKAAATQLPVDQLVEQQALQRVIDDCLQSMLHNEKEQLVFFLRYECGEPPRAIFAKHGAEFQSYETVANTLQRITRRLRASDCWRQLTQAMPASPTPPRRKTGEIALLKLELDDHSLESKKDINVDTPCPYNEAILIDYLCNLVSAELALAIEASPACRQSARQLAQTEGPWLTALYRRHCPSVATLLAYQARELPARERLLWYRHLEHCPCCQEELALLAPPEAHAAVALFAGLRRVVEAVFQSPLAMQFQGEWQQYRTPQITINIDERQSSGKPRTWTMRAQVRDQDGQQLTHQVELATLEALTPEVPSQPMNGTLSTSSIVFRDLPAGEYSLQIVLPEEEIIIRQLTVGFTT